MSKIIENQTDPTCEGKNPAAVALGRLARGHKKTLSAEERERRRRHLDTVRPRKPPEWVPVEDADKV